MAQVKDSDNPLHNARQLLTLAENILSESEKVEDVSKIILVSKAGELLIRACQYYTDHVHIAGDHGVKVFQLDNAIQDANKILFNLAKNDAPPREEFSAYVFSKKFSDYVFSNFKQLNKSLRRQELDAQEESR